ncbi:MAG: amidoligase family protein [Proteobacteria bacterium]|nr:amidoligase family protein [Pseudomonadota bacterium]
MSHYVLPDRKIFSETGETRRVGYEIEFAGLDLLEVADLVARAVAGKVNKQTEAECLVDSDLGEFGVELDWQLGKEMARDRMAARRDKKGVDETEDPLMQWVTSTAAQIVPIEIVCPPISMDALHQLDPMIDALRAAGARGTHASPVYAFGVHINPELPDLEAATIARYLWLSA